MPTQDYAANSPQDNAVKPPQDKPPQGNAAPARADHNGSIIHWLGATVCITVVCLVVLQVTMGKGLTDVFVSGFIGLSSTAIGGLAGFMNQASTK